MARIYHLRPADLRDLTAAELGAFRDDLAGRRDEGSSDG